MTITYEHTLTRPKLAVWKFASCDGCQLTLLNCEDELIPLAGEVQIAYFPEATRSVVEGPYDVSLVEGSVTTPEEMERIQRIREVSRRLITIGACATSGGIQALRNFGDIAEFRSIVYAHPEYLSTLSRSTPISAHVSVDFELRGCPINKHQLLEVLAAAIQGRKPRIPSYSVCVECKRRGTVCVAVANGTPCLGPVTQAGCGALCPAFDRGCYGCFGPQDTPNTSSLANQLLSLGLRQGVDRTAGHHGADLRDLPGRLPDELMRGDRGCLRCHGSRGHRVDAAAAVLRGVDRKPCAAHLPAARPGFPWLRRGDRDGRGPPEGGRARAPAEEGRQRSDGPGRRTLGASDQRTDRRVLQDAVGGRVAPHPAGARTCA